MCDIISFGIIGCGHVAHLHAHAIAALEDGVLAGVYDADPARCGAFARQYGAKTYATMEAMLADPGVAAVCVCTPSGLHGQHTLAALRHGKHAVIEKPVCLTLEEADAVIEAAAARDLKTCVISQLRFAPAVRQAKDALRQGLLGRLSLVSLDMKYYRSHTYYREGGWRGTLSMDGGGALMNQGIHGLDLLCALAGPVRWVYAQNRTLSHDIEVEDTLACVAELGCGALATVQASTSAYPGFPRRLQFCGELGSIVLEEDAIAYWHVRDMPAPAFAGTGPVTDTARDPTRLSWAGHRQQLADFISALRGERDVLVDAREARVTLEVLHAIYTSADTGRTVYL